MTTFTVATSNAIHMNEFQVAGLMTGTFGNESSTGFQVDAGGGYTVAYTGTGLNYDGAGHVIGGTLTGITESASGSTIFTIGSANVAAADFAQWAHDSNNDAALNALFGGNDSIVGGIGADILTGLAGHDVVMGGAGSDTILGGGGNDHLYGQSPNGGTDGADSISGGDGSDYIQGNAGNDTLDGGNDSDRINGGANNDLISGGSGTDSINGNAGNDTIDGGDGNDFLRGGKDADLVQGGANDDVIMGDIGNDTLVGGTGLDKLTGGADADTFRFAAGDASFAHTGASAFATDIITDYTPGTDHIALGFSVAAVLTGSSDSASSAATLAQQLLDGHAGNGEVAAVQVGSSSYLFYAGSGGATVDSGILASGVAATSFSTSDFV